MIESILKAREIAGMPEVQLKKLETSLDAKSIDEIEEKFNEDKFMMKNLSASESIHFDFQENSTMRSLSAKSLEDEFGEGSI